MRWHHGYDVEGSPLRQRLAIVRELLGEAVSAAPVDRPVRILSLCAGRGADVVGVLAGHPRAAEVDARLVELDPDLAGCARADVAAAGLDRVDVVTGDASTTDAAVGAAPTDVLLACGIFGNVSDADIRDFVASAPSLCRPAATVIWTRHRRPPDLTDDIRSWFAQEGFEEIAFSSPDAAGFVGVGAHRLARTPDPFVPGRRLFTFVGDGRPR